VPHEHSVGTEALAAAPVREQAADDEYVGWTSQQLLGQQRYSTAQDEQQCYYVGIETPHDFGLFYKIIFLFFRA
jgi:hypothetical protein